MSALPQHAPAVDRVRANTWPDVNARLDRLTELRLRAAAGDADSTRIGRELARLDGEWDTDRIIETEAPLMGLVGLALGLAIDRRFLAVPAVVSTMVLVHATHGWYPLLPVFRRLGVRSADEIDRERYALKQLRGDFSDLPVPNGAAAERAEAAWKAVCA